MAALAAKVGTLVLKTLAKPLAKHFQEYVMAHPTARNYAVSVAQSLHRLEVTITRAAEGKTGKVIVGEMTQEKSLEMAGKLASEGFVFAFGIVIMGFEYERQRQKEIVKKAHEELEKQAVVQQATLERERLARENREQTQLIRALAERVESLDAHLERLVSTAVQQQQQQQQNQGQKPKATELFGGLPGARAQEGAAALAAGAAQGAATAGT